ncbi:hypothetical protein [Agromyces sp. Root81]|nr:hypothetical protein [Agromyces sp. Root81]
MTPELWLPVICAAGLVVPLLLGFAARRPRPRPVRAQRPSTNRSPER